MSGFGTPLLARDLVERAMDGDTEAFGEIYLQYLNSIYRYVYFRVGNHHDAEDLVEGVFLKTWEALPTYKNCGNPFSSFLYRIAHNMVIDYHRQKKPLVSTSQNPAENNERDLVDLQAASFEQPNLLDQVIQAEEAEALAKAIEQLPEDQQQVIILRFIEGLSHGEISRIIDKSEGACRMIQYRALSALNGLLLNTRLTKDV